MQLQTEWPTLVCVDIWYWIFWDLTGQISCFRTCSSLDLLLYIYQRWTIMTVMNTRGYEGFRWFQAKGNEMSGGREHYGWLGVMSPLIVILKVNWSELILPDSWFSCFRYSGSTLKAPIMSALFFTLFNEIIKTNKKKTTQTLILQRVRTYTPMH